MSEGIVYQNKDIEFKLLSEAYKEKSFEAYGLELPRIKQVLPTNLPSVTANEKHMDNLFKKIGEERINRLNMFLLQEKRFGDLERSICDKEFQKQLMLQYGV